MAERQMCSDISSIRGDHLERYEYAMSICSGDILDAACGVGYGSFLMYHQPRIDKIDAVDISAEAIQMAYDSWLNNKTTFHCSDLHAFEFKKKYNWLVSFETIEHVPKIEDFLLKASKHCKNIICSVPNENVLPFTPEAFPFHLRHYKLNEIKELLADCGFDPHTIKYQTTKHKSGLTIREGRTIIIEGISKNF